MVCEKSLVKQFMPYFVKGFFATILEENMGNLCHANDGLIWEVSFGYHRGSLTFIYHRRIATKGNRSDSGKNLHYSYRKKVWQIQQTCYHTLSRLITYLQISKGSPWGISEGIPRGIYEAIRKATIKSSETFSKESINSFLMFLSFELAARCRISIFEGVE